MTNIEIVSLIVTIVCLLTFSIVFTILFKHYYDTNIDQVKSGKEDLNIIENALEVAKTSKSNKVLRIIGQVVSYIVFAIIIAFFGLSLYSRFSGNSIPFGDSTLVVIATGSMSEKNEDNTYLEINNLNNQFNAYDIIGITKYQSQDDVNLYDVVAFKNEDGTTIVHRIVEINEVNGENVYITRGDANNANDTNYQYVDYLDYDNIIGYYNGTRIQSVGIFIIFLQSNAGIITIISIAYCLFMFDYFSNKFDKAVDERTKFLAEKMNLDFNIEDFDIPVIKYKEEIYVSNNMYVIENESVIDKIENVEKPMIEDIYEGEEESFFKNITIKIKEKLNKLKKDK